MVVESNSFNWLFGRKWCDKMKIYSFSFIIIFLLYIRSLYFFVNLFLIINNFRWEYHNLFICWIGREKKIRKSKQLVVFGARILFKS